MNYNDSRAKPLEVRSSEGLGGISGYAREWLWRSEATVQDGEIADNVEFGDRSVVFDIRGEACGSRRLTG